MVNAQLEHFWCQDEPWATWTHKTHHGPDLGETITFPFIVYSVPLQEAQNIISAKEFRRISDALPSPGLNPLEGPTMLSCGKLGLGRRSRLPTLERGRGACQKSQDQTRKRDQQIKLESASKTNHTGVSSHSGTPLGVGTSHGHFGPQDSPRPGLGGSHHLPPYSILCSSPLRLHPNGSFSRDSQVGVLKLSKNCPGWSPGTLEAHISRFPSPIGARSEPMLQLSSRVFQRHVAHCHRTSGIGLFPTFSGRESNCQFDSRPFFCP